MTEFLLLARKPLTNHVSYFVTAVPQVYFTRLRPRARVMDRECCAAWAVYLAVLGHDVYPVVYKPKVSTQKNAPIAPKSKTCTEEITKMFSPLLRNTSQS